MPSDVTHATPAQRLPCLTNHQRRITVAVVRHGACQTAKGHRVVRDAGKISKFLSYL